MKLSNEVYVLLLRLDHEGDSVEGVYVSYSAAKKIADERNEAEKSRSWQYIVEAWEVVE